MPELMPADVAAFTSGRLPASGNDEVQAMLDAALRTARRYCGWHVSPVKTAHVVQMDGPNSRMLWIPTRKLITLTSVVEDGTTLDVSTISASVGDGVEFDRPVVLRKRSGGFWSGEYGAITVTMTHGFTEAEAADWRRAVLSMVDQMSQVPIRVATGPGELASIRVDDVQYSYQNWSAAADEALWSVSSLMDDYALPRAELI